MRGNPGAALAQPPQRMPARLPDLHGRHHDRRPGAATDVFSDPVLSDAQRLRDLEAGRLADPFALLGPHRVEGRWLVRSLQPGARAVHVLDAADPRRVLAELAPLSADGLFSGAVDAWDDGSHGDYLLDICWPDPASGGSAHQLTEDPYSFGPLLGDLDLHLFAEGRHLDLGSCLGAQSMCVAGVPGIRFAVWAPNARSVSVIGEFNGWDACRHPMRLRHGAGIWELFIPRLETGTLYRYRIVGAGGELLEKSDPVARAAEAPPGNASRIPDAAPFRWTDDAWMRRRAALDHAAQPISVYEVHAGSWRRFDHADGWQELAERLVPYVAALGFTHIELLPVMEHPFGGSWGYQPLGLFAPSARFGSPAGFAAFVDRCHAAGLGVILDWVPAHFPSDPHGLARFDGSALYEHQDPREGWHPDWNTLIYNLGRNEVVGFLVASALEWLQRYHVDGLRVDAVSSMLYRDYSRKAGEWIPNVHGGRENLESMAFLRRLNRAVAERCPGAMVIAEESTAWPGVTAPEEEGGLGFSFKWNMGWMHDTLRYMRRDPLWRRHHHADLTFGLDYAFSERFMLAISHDEVVHGKGSLWQKMPGPTEQKFAALRAYLAFMWMHPGKKLLFMGCEFGQVAEWNHDGELQWDLLDDPRHRGVQRLVGDLNALYRKERSLHEGDCDRDGFAWLVADDAANSVVAFLRRSTRDAGAPLLLAVCNFTPVARTAYRVGIPRAGDRDGRQVRWREALNTDSAFYGGGNRGNQGMAVAEDRPSHGQPMSLVLTLPPLSTLIFRQEN